MTDTGNGWGGRAPRDSGFSGASGTSGASEVAGVSEDAGAGHVEPSPGARRHGPIPGPRLPRPAGSRLRARRVTAVSVVALAALATGCEPGAAPGAQTAPRQTPATRPAAPSPARTEPAPAPSTAEPSTVPPPRPSASTPAPAPTTARPAPEPSAAPPARVLMRTGSESDRVRELQARLRQIGHFGRNPTGYYGSVTADSVRSFQAKRGLTATGSTDEATWKRLLAMTRTPTAEELRPPTERPLATPDKRCLTGRVLCVSKSSRTLAWMIDGRVVSAMDVRFGSEYTPTREGEFEVFWKSRDHVSTLYDTPMPYALFFSGGQAVHYSADFAANGYGGASHGCVNVRDKKKVAALFDQVKNGDKVVVFR
ncbi:L,D-transpeptidase family protein [Streptomyces californicus]|uniref:L,D-transpeptidase family protein n=1 Tax=Streptomyces californicus TaxID=67351 RepID=UPI00382383EB